MKTVKISFVLLLFLIIMGSCSTNKYDVDISDINIEIDYKQFEKDLFLCDTSKIWNEIDYISDTYDEFWKIFTNQIIQIGNSNNREFASLVTDFITDPMIKESYEKKLEIFPDFTIHKNEIETSFKYFKYHFPNKQTPDLYTYIGGFNQSIITDAAILGVGLDKYYGSDCNFYSQLRIPDYAKKKLDKKYIVNDCMQAWGYMEFEFIDSLGYLVNTMIYEGKILYFINSMMPKQAEFHIIKYSEPELEWCKQNEKEMWKYLIENKLLFSTKYENIVRLTQDGPFTTGFSQDSPGKAGNWIGLQIVKKYMDRNKDVSLSDLMSENDYQKILNFSKYNP